MAFFRLRIIQFEKKKFENFFIFLKILTQNDPFWSKFRPKKANLTKNIFFVILKSYDFQRGVTCLCLNKIMKIGIFCIKMACRALFGPFLCPNWSKWSIPSLFNLDSLETIRICIFRLIVPAKDDIFTKTISPPPPPPPPPPPDSYDSNTPPGHTGRGQG